MKYGSGTTTVIFILFYFVVNSWKILTLKFKKWTIFHLKIPVSIGQICQAFEFAFSFGIDFWHSF
jgi:hypothetical protein